MRRFFMLPLFHLVMSQISIFHWIMRQVLKVFYIQGFSYLSEVWGQGPVELWEKTFEPLIRIGKF